jgi:hypothetical protein
MLPWAIEPVLIMLLARAVLRERIGRLLALAMADAVGGVRLVVAQSDARAGTGRRTRGSPRRDHRLRRARRGRRDRVSLSITHDSTVDIAKAPIGRESPGRNVITCAPPGLRTPKPRS